MADVRWVDVGRLAAMMTEDAERIGSLALKRHADNLRRGDFDAPAPPALDRGKVVAWLDKNVRETDAMKHEYGEGANHAYRRMRDNVEAGAFDLAPAPPPAPAAEGEDDGAAKGMYRKFDVRRVDGESEPGGKHHGCEYFVVDITHDPHAMAACLAYADACESDRPELAADLRMRFTGSPVALMASQPPAAGAGEDDEPVKPDDLFECIGAIDMVMWNDLPFLQSERLNKAWRKANGDDHPAHRRRMEVYSAILKGSPS